MPPMTRNRVLGPAAAAVAAFQMQQHIEVADQFVPPQLRGRDKDAFIYTVEFLPLAAGGTATGNISIQADSGFLAMDLVRVVTDTGNTTFLTNAPALINVADAGSGRNLMDRPVHVDNLLGTVQLPGRWYPRFFSASSTIIVQLQNLEAVDRNYRISFIGFKVF